MLARRLAPKPKTVAVRQCTRLLQQCALSDASSVQQDIPVSTSQWAARNAMVLAPHDLAQVRHCLDEASTWQIPSIVDHLPPVPQGRSRLFLCRHGQTDANLFNRFQGRGVNTTLNLTGVKQASCLAHCLRHVPLTAIYCSALRRAHQTAAIAAQFHSNLDISPCHELEEMSFGIMEGHPHAQFEQELNAVQSKWDHGEFGIRLRAGECPLDVVQRGATKIQELLRRSEPQEQVLVVSHGRFNKIVLAQLLYGSLDNMMTLTQDNTCINVVDYDHATRTFLPVVLNTTMHLPSFLFRSSYQ